MKKSFLILFLIQFSQINENKQIKFETGNHSIITKHIITLQVLHSDILHKLLYSKQNKEELLDTKSHYFM